MSTRRQALSGGASNPAAKFFKWNSNDKCFSFYNKETKENELVSLPFRFIVLDQLSTVKGWNDRLSGGIVSNEVRYLGKEKLTVVCYHGEQKTKIVEGLYSEIKEKVIAEGGRYHNSVYVMLEDGSIANLQFKGAGAGEWQKFSKAKNRLVDEWVIVKGHTDGKKGSVKFTTPKFEFERSMNDSESELADSNYDTLKAYLDQYLVKNIPVNEPEEVENEYTDTYDEGDLVF
jgi:membrane-bound inhibitor of C-type lysozyme